MPDVRYSVFRPANAPRRVIDPGIDRIARELCRDIADRTPVGRTGKLRAAWRVTTNTVPRGWGVRLVVNDTEYASFVEYGTRRRAARPFKGPVLAAYKARWER